jgi:hypothetical protein
MVILTETDLSVDPEKAFSLRMSEETAVYGYKVLQIFYLGVCVAKECVGDDIWCDTKKRQQILNRLARQVGISLAQVCSFVAATAAS